MNFRLKQDLSRHGSRKLQLYKVGKARAGVADGEFGPSGRFSGRKAGRNGSGNSATYRIRIQDTYVRAGWVRRYGTETTRVIQTSRADSMREGVSIEPSLGIDRQQPRIRLNGGTL